MEWQPIETAPKDGTIVLLGRWSYGARFWEPVTGRFECGSWCLSEAGDYASSRDLDSDPTHWQPLPPPPPKD